jgi:hypothetical protein
VVARFIVLCRSLYDNVAQAFIGFVMTVINQFGKF